jgi:hypothetical protein
VEDGPDLERRKEPAAVCEELVAVHPTARHDRGGDDLAVLLVGDAVDDRLPDCRVAKEDVLDLKRRDVFAASDDDLLDPAYQPEIAVGDDARAPCSELFAEEGSLVRPLVSEVAGHDPWAANDDLSGSIPLADARRFRRRCGSPHRSRYRRSPRGVRPAGAFAAISRLPSVIP